MTSRIKTRSGLELLPSKCTRPSRSNPSSVMAESAELQNVIASLLEDRKAMQANVDRLLKVVADQADRIRDADGGGDRTGEGDIKLQKLAESDDIEAYLTTFERVMRAYNVKAERWVYKLAPNLTGRAQLAYAGMPSAEEGDYKALKEAILKRYDINEEAYRQRFRAATLKDTESYRELAVRVKDLLNKWMKDHKGSVEEVLEQVALEQFASELPQDVHFYMQEKKPGTVLVAGQLVDEYFLWKKQRPSENNAGNGVIQCEYCDSRGHKASECRKAEADRASAKGKEEGVKPEVARPKFDRSRWRCFNCQGLGHIANDCPHNKVQINGFSEVVYMNEDIDPRITRAGTVEGKTVERIILDTGCARTMVRQELVPHAQVTGQVPIRCAHGDTRIYPLARVRIGVGGVDYTVEAAVSNKLPVAVLLGRDVTDLMDMLQEEIPTTRVRDQYGQDACAVTTRRQAKLLQREELERARKEEEDGAIPNRVDTESELEEQELDTGGWDSNDNGEEDEQVDPLEVPGCAFDPELFLEGETRPRKTRSEKRSQRRIFTQAMNGTAQGEQWPAHPMEPGIAAMRFQRPMSQGHRQRKCRRTGLISSTRHSVAGEGKGNVRNTSSEQSVLCVM